MRVYLQGETDDPCLDILHFTVAPGFRPIAGDPPAEPALLGWDPDTGDLGWVVPGNWLEITDGVLDVVPPPLVASLGELTDPDADRLLFWDDSADDLAWLTVGSGLLISGTTITAPAVTPAGAPTAVQFNADGAVFGADNAIQIAAGNITCDEAAGRSASIGYGVPGVHADAGSLVAELCREDIPAAVYATDGTRTVHLADGTFAYDGSGPGRFTGVGAAVVVLTVQGASSQTADLQQFKNSSGTTLARVDAAGFLAWPGATTFDGGLGVGTGLGLLSASHATTEVPAGFAWVHKGRNVFIPNNNARLYGINIENWQNATPTVVPIVVEAHGSQTGNLQEWCSSSGTTVYSTVSENGYFTTRKTSAPADAELSASEVAFWFDDTDGAAKLKIKGKSADGTVVTGEVALA